MKVQKADHTLRNISIVSASQADVVQEATSFMTACYGYHKFTTMTDVRRKLWKY